MRLVPSDPDLVTIINRIEDRSLDLQPDFQRGAVWSQPKQRLLIDSILRGWYVPPVHVVRTDEDEQEVLDGQQRLRAIHEFVRGRFDADGSTEPASEDIASLDGLRYDELPDRIRRRFDRFTLRVFELVDYEPEEPYELFFRLNQPTTLTAAEKRNAFVGEARAQVKRLSEIAQRSGMDPGRIGFSNARLAYEDVVARFIWTLETGSLAEKVTASRITTRYRAPEPFDDSLISLAESALTNLFGLSVFDDESVRLNKATAHSWLLFLARRINRGQERPDMNALVRWIETSRLRIRHLDTESLLPAPDDASRLLFGVLNDRASARVNDVSSVLLRDVSLWALTTLFDDVAGSAPSRRFLEAVQGARSPAEAEDELLEVVAREQWELLK